MNYGERSKDCVGSLKSRNYKGIKSQLIKTTRLKSLSSTIDFRENDQKWPNDKR